MVPRINKAPKINVRNKPRQANLKIFDPLEEFHIKPDPVIQSKSPSYRKAKDLTDKIMLKAKTESGRQPKTVIEALIMLKVSKEMSKEILFRIYSAQDNTPERAKQIVDQQMDSFWDSTFAKVNSQSRKN